MAQLSRQSPHGRGALKPAPPLLPYRHHQWPFTAGATGLNATMDNISQNDYVQQVLTAYCHTPTTAGRTNRHDRLLAVRFYERHIPLDVIENAFVLGAVGRVYCDPDNPPCRPLQSLYYFGGLIDGGLNRKRHANTRSA